jgi:hypothetical protein
LEAVDYAKKHSIRATALHFNVVVQNSIIIQLKIARQLLFSCWPFE